MNQERDVKEAYDHYKRFQMDLEFVQLLANPNYLHCTSPPVISFSPRQDTVLPR